MLIMSAIMANCSGFQGDVAVAGDLEQLLGIIHDAVHLDLAAADNQVLARRNGRGMLREGETGEQAAVASRGDDVGA